MDIIILIFGYLALIAVGIIMIAGGALGESVPLYIGGFVLIFASAAYGLYDLTNSAIIAGIIGGFAVLLPYKFLFGR